MRDIHEVIRSQRAHRAFATDEIADDVLEMILEAGTYAPSAENSQPWVFVVVRDSARRAAIHDVVEQLWGKVRESTRERLSQELFDDVERGVAGGGYRTAPLLVVVCADLRRTFESTAPASVFPCIQNMLLTATALGLGSALTTLAAHDSSGMRELLDLPAEIMPVAVVPIGWPARPLGRPRREPVARHTRYERYGPA